jgi:hypothetical protein
MVSAGLKYIVILATGVGAEEEGGDHIAVRMARAIAALPDIHRDVPKQSISFFTKKLLNFLFVQNKTKYREPEKPRGTFYFSCGRWQDIFGTHTRH